MCPINTLETVYNVCTFQANVPAEQQQKALELYMEYGHNWLGTIIDLAYSLLM